MDFNNFTEVARDDEFSLVEDLEGESLHNIVLLVIKRHKCNNKIKLLCTDFTSNQQLRTFTKYYEEGSFIEPSMLIYLLCYGKAASAIEKAMDENPNYEILQFKNCKVNKNFKNGIELILGDSAVVTNKNNCEVLNFNLVPDENNFYYKNLIRKHQEYLKKVKNYVVNYFEPVNFSTSSIPDQEFFDENATEENQNERAIGSEESNSIQESGENLNNDLIFLGIRKRNTDSSIIVEKEYLVFEDLFIQSNNEKLVKYTVKLIGAIPGPAKQLFRFGCPVGCWLSESVFDPFNPSNYTDTSLKVDKEYFCNKCGEKMDMALTMLYSCEYKVNERKKNIWFIASHDLSDKILTSGLDNEAKQKEVFNNARCQLHKLTTKCFDVYVLPIPFYEQGNIKVFQIGKLVQFN